MKKQAKILVASLLFAAGVAPALASANNFEVNDNTNLTNNTQDILVLYDSGQDENGKTNTEILRDGPIGPIRIQLEGRTLYQDGTWNTIFLPFDLDIKGTIFEGATVMSFNGSHFDSSTGELTLDFEKDYEIILAGMPYFVKWENGGENITNPIFNDVTIDFNKVASPDVIGTTYADFIGVFDNMTFGEERKDILYLGANNELFYPSPKDGEPVTIGAFRCYFELHLSENQSARAFQLNFGDEETVITSIIAVESISPAEESWYTFDGRRLSGKPSTSGLYISNGRKVIIK